MPSKSQKQFKYIMYLRSKYENKKNTPEKDKWIWDSEWTDVKYGDLPKEKTLTTEDLLLEMLGSTGSFKEYKEEMELNDQTYIDLLYDFNTPNNDLKYHLKNVRFNEEINHISKSFVTYVNKSLEENKNTADIIYDFLDTKNINKIKKEMIKNLAEKYKGKYTDGQIENTLKETFEPLESKDMGDRLKQLTTELKKVEDVEYDDFFDESNIDDLTAWVELISKDGKVPEDFVKEFSDIVKYELKTNDKVSGKEESKEKNKNITMANVYSVLEESGNLKQIYFVMKKAETILTKSLNGVLAEVGEHGGDQTRVNEITGTKVYVVLYFVLASILKYSSELADNKQTVMTEMYFYNEFAFRPIRFSKSVLVAIINKFKVDNFQALLKDYNTFNKVIQKSLVNINYDMETLLKLMKDINYNIPTLNSEEIYNFVNGEVSGDPKKIIGAKRTLYKNLSNPIINTNVIRAIFNNQNVKKSTGASLGSALGKMVNKTQNFVSSPKPTNTGEENV